MAEQTVNELLNEEIKKLIAEDLCSDSEIVDFCASMMMPKREPEAIQEALKRQFILMQIHKYTSLLGSILGSQTPMEEPRYVMSLAIKVLRDSEMTSKMTAGLVPSERRQ